MRQESLFEIVVLKGANAQALRPEQKEFNRLTKNIAQKRAQIEALNNMAERIQKRAATELRPLIDKYNEARAALVRLLDRMHRNYKFTKAEARKMAFFISELSVALIENGMEDLKEIYNRHNPKADFDTMQAEGEDRTVEMMKEMLGSLYGVDFDPDADVSSPEKMMAYMAMKMAEKEAQQEAFDEKRRARQAARPKTPQQLKAEAKRAAQEEKAKLEAKKISQSVREVYMDLVKAFHPDREPDEQEKIRKTAILQRVTAAYEANDLLGLLQLQLELERIDGSHLEQLADDKLRYFNKSLKKQLAELEDELMDIEGILAQMANTAPFSYFNPNQTEALFEKQLKALKKDIKQTNEELEVLRDHGALKTWLKYVDVNDPDW